MQVFGKSSRMTDEELIMFFRRLLRTLKGSRIHYVENVDFKLDKRTTY